MIAVYKKFLMFFAVKVLLCVSASIVWSETMDDLVKRDNIYYKKFSDVPFTGEVYGLETIYGALGDGFISKGRKEGSWTYYWKGKRVEKKINYKNGKLDGSWVLYHINGEISFKGNYINGKKEGVWVSYYDDGSLTLRNNYKNDKQEGPTIQFHPNGQLFLKGKYKNDKEEGPWKIYHPSGQLLEKGNFKKGKREGPWIINNINIDGTIDKEKSGIYRNNLKISD